MKKFILASASPRRREILLERNFKFVVVPSTIDEQFDKNLSHYKAVEKIALSKAQSVFDKMQLPTLGCDTVVVLDGEVLGKPKDSENAIEMLKKLSGKCHEVISAFAFITKDKTFVDFDVTKVYFNVLTNETILEYVKTGSPLDKAGAYGIQDGFGLVDRYEGSYYNVMGLPIEKIEEFFTAEEL